MLHILTLNLYIYLFNEQNPTNIAISNNLVIKFTKKNVAIIRVFRVKLSLNKRRNKGDL